MTWPHHPACFGGSCDVLSCRTWAAIHPPTDEPTEVSAPAHDTIPAPQAHPVEREILEDWERGLAYHDTEEEARAFREGMAFLLRQSERRP